MPIVAAAAGVIGAVGSYLFAGWISRRSAGRYTRQQAVILTGAAVTVLCLAPAAIACAAGIWGATRGGVRVPVVYWAGFSAYDLRPAVDAAVVALAVTLGALALTRPAAADGEAVTG